MLTKILLLCLSFYVLLFFFRSRKHTNLPDDSGSSHWFPSIRVSTGIFNTALQKFGRNYKTACRFWFTLGAACSIAAIFPVIYLFTETCISQIVQLFMPHGTVGEAVEASLEPVLPGVNIHGNDIIHYIAVIFISSVFHELGHALAATSEYLTIHGTGFLLVLIFPAAFVDLPSTDLNLLPTLSQIRIFTAGVWHNVVLALIAWLTLLSMPTLMLPLFQTQSGVLVVDLAQDSPLTGETGLHVMEVIQYIDGCKVHDEKSWRSCLLQTLKEESPGFCTGSNITGKVGHMNLDTTTSEECCRNGTESSLCFKSETFAVCLPARTVVQHSILCHQRKCPDTYDCLIPWTQATNSSLPRLVVIRTLSGKEILFLGHPGEIYSSVKVSPYITDKKILAYFPGIVKKFLLYLCSISAGLACVNLIPCIGLDGFHLSRICVLILLRHRCHPQTVENVHRIVTLIGTLLIILTLLLSFIRYLI